MTLKLGDIELQITPDVKKEEQTIFHRDNGPTDINQEAFQTYKNL